jgi:nanoRNase/pAp phosphatase (c-di-AMP/oligoRNAs hydrolase)
MRVHVLFHDHCFDGLASAATFTRFYRERIDPSATFTYRGLTHKEGSSYDPSPFTDAEVHACVDFRYSPSPKLTWWFDHHQSAFEKTEDEAHFRAVQSDKQFHDPKAKSCTKFLARVTQEKFGFNPAPLHELIDWAEMIDSASFPDAKTAVMLDAPAMKLMMLAEATQDDALLQEIIRQLADKPLSDVIASPLVAEPLKPLLEKHFKTVDVIKSRAKLDGDIVTFDVADLGIDSFNKFVSYYVYPQATYQVAVSAGKKRAKVSVSSNAWRPEARRHNIAAICESYGGGGHPVVGAISFPPDQLDRARQVAAEVVAKLKT